MSERRQTVLVTGGAGFIGSHLVDRLVHDGHRVSVVDNFSTGSEQNLRQAMDAGLRRDLIFHMDILGPELGPLLARLRPDAVVHLAAQGQVTVSMREPSRDLEANSLGTVRVLEAARSCGVGKMVLSSSGGTVYGAGSIRQGATNEADAKVPASFYGLSKATADEYARLYHQHFGLDYASLALGNVYGPRQNPHGEAGVLSIFCHLLASGQDCEITGDGSAVRDYVHVYDVVRAFVRALVRGHGLINIGTGVGTSVLEAYRLLAERAGVTRPPIFVSSRPGEVTRIVLDHSRATLELGWSPSIPLAEGIDDLLTWARQRRRISAGAGTVRRPEDLLADTEKGSGTHSVIW